MADPSWQELLRTRLTERNARESTFSPIIEQYHRLAHQTKLLKERNASLLRAVGTVRGNPSSSTVFVPGSNSGDDHQVLSAYSAELESQISVLREDLASVYKTQTQNTQRLLAMNETLREKEELSRLDSEALRKCREEIAVFKRKVDQHAELMAEKDRNVQILHDEISTLQLELGQIEDRNQTLTKDNAKLLQRWLDAKQVEANKMNEANEFYENMRTRHQAVLNWRDGSEDGVEEPHNGAETASQTSTSVSGKGGGRTNDRPNAKKDGTASPATKQVDLTPNG